MTTKKATKQTTPVKLGKIVKDNPIVSEDKPAVEETIKPNKVKDDSKKMTIRDLLSNTNKNNNMNNLFQKFKKK